MTAALEPGMRSTRVGLAAFGLNVVLLFFPPLPPVYKGSVWSYALSYLAVLLVLRDAPRWGPSLTAAWSARTVWSRGARAALLVAGVALAGALVRTLSSELFMRFSREEGLWEPISLTCYAGSAILLFRAARPLSARAARHVRVLAAGFVILTLEEVDYFGIFGGIIGHVDGIYTGALHDLIRLVDAGLLPGAVMGGAALVVALVTGTLLVRGYLQPRRLALMLGSAQGVWLLAGFAFLVLASAEEASLLGVEFGHPTPEELIECLGSLCLAAFTLEVVAAERQTGAEAGAPG